MGSADLPVLMELEQPFQGGALSADSTVRGFGWVLANEPIVSLSCFLDEVFLCRAVLGLVRTDIAKEFAEYGAHDKAGFSFTATIPDRPTGPAVLTLKAKTASGEHVHVVPVDIVAWQPIPARPEWVDPLLLEVEKATIAPGGLVEISGWALGLLPIRSVEVLIGDRSLGLAEGEQQREDLLPAYAAYPNALTGGFRIAVVLDPEEVTPASALLVTVIVTDSEGEARTVILPFDTVESLERPTARMPQAMLAALEEARITDLGILRVRGWAVSLAAIDHIRVFLGDRVLGNAEKFISRDDVGAAHPDYPEAGFSGFLLQQELPDAELPDPGNPADCVVRVVVSAVGGIQRELKAPLAIAPSIQRRTHKAVVHFHCDEVSLSEDGSLAVKGWVVCPSGIEAIVFSLDGVEVGTTTTGGERADVGNHFPEFPAARKSGFAFTCVLATPVSGEQIVQIAVRGTDGEERTILQPVLASPVEARPQGGAGGDTEHIKFYLENPGVQNGVAVESVRGFMSVNGWAFARAGIADIEVFVDGASQGMAYHGIRREDLESAFPNWNALLSGFAMIISPQVLKKGLHEVRMVIRDKAGHAEEMSFSILAEPAAEGPGPWLLRRKLTQAEVELQLALLHASSYCPRWRLVMPLQGGAAGDIRRARETILSLRHHAYTDWRMTIALPAGSDFAALTTELLLHCEDLAPRIDILIGKPDQALADFAQDGPGPALVALLSPGDVLGEDALLEMSVEAAVQGLPDFIYSDERRIDPSDRAMKAFFKPDWSPDLLLTTNYVGRLWAATPDLLRRADLHLGCIEQHGHYDAVLRLTEQARQVGHVSRVLCARGGGRQDSAALERRALRRAVTRRGIKAEILPGCLPGSWRCKRDAGQGTRLSASTKPSAADTATMVSIIIPTIASRGLIKITIDSIRAKTAWTNYEIILLDNIGVTDDPEKLEWKAWMRANADAVIDVRERFNWSRLNNRGARRARGAYLLFLNDDMEILDADWLHGLMEHAQRPEVGIVGPQLLYPDGRVQHAGVFLSREVGRHAFRFYPRDEPGAFGLALSQRNVISVTGACMLMRRAAFDRLGGFDEAHAVINNDLDMALRAHASGLLNVYTPHVTLIHHEMVSRFKMKDTYNSKHFDATWKNLFLKGDPYFNTQMTSDYDDYLAEVEPLRRLQVGHPIISHDRVHRILAIKVDHIGDFIAAFPSFRRLKQHFPHAELTVLAAKASLSLAAMEPAIDRVIEYNFFHARSERGRRSLVQKELLELEEKLAPYRFDLALDLRRQPDTRPLLKVSGARWLAGFEQHNDMKWLDIAIEWEGDLARSAKRTHVTDSLVQLVDAVSVACDSDRRVVRVPQQASEARVTLAALPAVKPIAAALFARRIVCVHTGAGAVNKQWPAASFAGLIDLLVAGEDVNVMIIGGPDEAEFAASVEALIRKPERVTSLVGKTGLRDLPTALLSAVLYIGNDSGPKHMAASLGVPTIGIHSGTVDAGEWGPMGVHALTIRRDMTCSPCYLARASDCHRGLACLYGIKVGDVYNACRRMLLLNPALPSLLASPSLPALPSLMENPVS